jgi:hypothetical protein
VGVHVHGQVEALAQGRDELLGGAGAQQARHVLDREDVRARVDDLLGEAQVVVERVEVLGGVEQVARVAERDLGDRRVRREHGVDRGTHLVDVVQGVEDAEDVDARGGRLLHEGLGDLGGVRRVADGVAPAQQHLDGDVGQRLAHLGEPLPRVLAEEAQGDVVGGAAPRLHREQLGGEARDVRHDRHEVLGAHARREQRLVRVAEGRLGDGERGLGAQGGGEAGRSQLEQTLARARGRGPCEIDLGQLARGVDRSPAVAVRLVDGDIGEPVEDLGAAVARLPSAHEPGALLDERGRHVAGEEVGVVEHRLQEGDVGRHPAQAEFREAPPCAPHGRGEVAAAADHLHEHRVEVRRHLRAGGDGPSVETDARPARRAVGRDLARVGSEPGRRVLGRDAALDGEAARSQLLLVEVEIGEGLPRGDPHLRLDEVDIRHLLGDGVLDLDARIHLDEDVLPGTIARGVEQELDGARVDVADRLRERDRVAMHGLADRLVEVRRGRDLDDLLVTALHRAVALEQVDRLPGGIGQDLHLDVPRPHDRLLDEHRGVAEGAVGLAHRGLERGPQLLAGVDPTHPAAAAARDRLGEHGEADLVGTGQQRLDVGGRRRRLEHRHARGDRVLLRRHLVAGHLEHVAAGADEGDAVVGGRLGQLGVLGEEAVAGVDRVGARLLRHPDDLGDVEVGTHGVPLLADQVRLVRLEAVHRVAILPGVHGHRAGPQLVCRTERTDRDLASVGHQDLREHAVLPADGAGRDGGLDSFRLVKVG